MKKLPRTLVIKKVSRQTFEVSDPTEPGSPPCGYGRTMKEAIGDWLHTNQRCLGLTFTIDRTAQAAENRRRLRELSGR